MADIEPNISSLADMTILGAGAIQVHFKETSEQVLDFWDEQLVPINKLFNDGTYSPSTDISQSVQNLINLAKNGLQYDIKVSSSPDVFKTVTDYISQPMAQDLDNLLRTLKAAAPNLPLDGTTFPFFSGNELDTWVDFSKMSPVINQILQHMNNARSVGGALQNDDQYLAELNLDPFGHLKLGSLQSMIELLYVKTGNDMLADNLDKLESALQVNQKALDSLSALQSLHNNLAAFSKGELPSEVGVLQNLVPVPPDPGPAQDAANATNAPIKAANDAVMNAYAAQGGAAATFFSSIIPELGPGLASAYDILGSYAKAYNSLSDLSTVIPGVSVGFDITDLLKSVKTDVSSIINTPSNWFEASHNNEVQAITRYRQFATNYNALVTRLNALMAPFVSATNTLPGQEIVLDNPNAPPAQIHLHLPAELLPMPSFSADEIPFAFSTGGEEGTSTGPAIQAWAAQVQAFSDQITFFTPPDTFFQGGVTNFEHDVIHDGTVITPAMVDAAADLLYKQPAVFQGDPSTGASPVAIFSISTQIIQQYQILQNQATELAKDPNQTGPNSLLARINQVLADIKNSGSGTLPDVSYFNSLSTPAERKAMITNITAFANNWVLDNLGSVNSSANGKIQENLGFAITAGQSLNDQQKEDTRRFLFLFEEFYKSASAILTKLTEIIEKMAQNVNR